MFKEFAGMKITMMMPGWSAHGGQAMSPYIGKIEDNEEILGHTVSRLNYKYYSFVLILSRLPWAHPRVLRSL